MPQSTKQPSLDSARETDRIVNLLRDAVHQRLRRRGAILGISGGVDSSVVLALCARAFGAERVVGVMMPEKESSQESIELASLVAEHYGVETVIEDITPALEGFGCYRRRDEAIKRLFPEFTSRWRARIVLPGSLLNHNTLNVFYLTVISPHGEEHTKRLPPDEYLQIVAASNFKQRTRMAFLYYHAESCNYAVVGTANKDEHDLGFFVKWGDGGIDVNPIVHLYKTQVFELARYLDVPKKIIQQTPTTDTYSAGSTQEEFFFRVPFEILDGVWSRSEVGTSTSQIAERVGLSMDQIQRVLDDIARKRRTTAYVRTPPIRLTGEVDS